MNIEDKILKLTEPSVNEVGYDIWRIKYFSKEQNTLQIMIDKLDGSGISVDDCAIVSNLISPILDVEDPIEAEYTLEVSSPGVDRPLVKLAHFEKFKGSKVKIILRLAVNNIRRFKGNIQEIIDRSVVFETNDGKVLTVEFDNIESASLIASEDL